jgi:hypothetical protein
MISAGQQRFKLLHVRVVLTRVEVDIAAASDQFQRFVLHRSIPFNHLTRAEIRSVSSNCRLRATGSPV